MILYPAIDISEGQAVRLVQGDFDEKTVYRDSPLEAARAWVEAGARFLHVVDLDGARTGSPQSRSTTSSRSPTSSRVPVQYGGGLRSLPAVRDALRAGAERVILGTAAYTDIDFLDDVLGAFRERVIVVASTRAAATSRPRAGSRRRRCRPRRSSSACSTAACARSSTRTSTATGCSRAPTSTRSGAIAGVVRGRFLYSGGIGSLDDLRGAARLRQVNLGGVIVGKALYEGRFTVAEGQAALEPARG